MSEPEYKLHKEDDWVIECDRCGSADVPTVATDWRDIGKRPEEISKDRRPKEYLCMFCYETHFGSIFEYRHHRDIEPLARAICQGLNLLARQQRHGDASGG